MALLCWACKSVCEKYGSFVKSFWGIPERLYVGLTRVLAAVDRVLLVRVITSIGWGTVFVFSLYCGGMAAYFLFFTLAMIAAFEWHQITGGRVLFYLPAFFVIVLPYASVAYIYSLSHGTIILFWLVSSVWSTDVAAYFFGKAFGGRKILPLISPGKTWSGLFGGVLFSTINSFLMSVVFGIFSVSHSLFVGVSIAVVAQLGDFLESAVKRVCKVKDSGFLVPGHGGVLDRMDGFIIAAPLTAYHIEHVSKFFAMG